MLTIILSYIIGVLCGIGYMYCRYCKMMRSHLDAIAELRVLNAKNTARLEMLCAIRGIKFEEEKDEVSTQ